MERTIQRIQPTKLAERKILRVAAYARVSCDKDAMKQSLAAQISYYSGIIQQHDGWMLAGVYADEAYSGTRNNRPQFVRLIEDCKAGKVDRIITKSISRFARNTLTLLNTVRELRRMGIGIYFEEQNIDTLTEAGELMITLLASQAQEESRITSENCKWRIKQKFEEGITTNFNMVGYRAINGLVQEIPEESDLVRRIYELYLEGYGKQGIANILFEENVACRLGGEWVSSTIGSILKNEKYIGDLLLQKYYIPDPLTKEIRKNKGELPQYFIQDDHTPIVSREVFAAVQKERGRRARKFTGARGETSELTSLVRCGICGKNYRRKTTAVRILWCCSTYNNRGKKYCDAKCIPETALKEACSQALGLAEYDALAVAERIEQIVAMPENMLVFHLKDGTTQQIKWSFPSRAESWTPEMREQAAQHARRRYGKTDE